MAEEKNGKDVSVSQRQIYILSLLSENPKGYQAEEIRERLQNWDIDVSKRTITRDIDELSLNYGIGEEERGGKTYYFADKYTLKNVDLTIEDLASLAFAHEVMKEYRHIHMGKHAMELIQRVVEQSAALNRRQFETLTSHVQQIQVKSNVDSIEEDVEKQIQMAIENKNKIEIDYYSFSSDKASKRVIHPYCMLLIDSNLCVEGFCELRKEIRRFRLSRIKSLMMLDEKFNDTLSEGVKSEGNLSRLRGGEAEPVELLFTGDSIRFVKEYESHRCKRMVEKEDGLHFYAESAITADVIRWIRGFGCDVQVIMPTWLEEKLLEEAKKRSGM